MSQAPTHYQISITAKQALSLFLGLLAVLGLSYFFGLMTGLAGSEAPEGAGAAEATSHAAEGSPPTPAAATEGVPRENVAFPVPVTAVPSAGGPAPASPKTVQVFEDGEGGTSPSRPAPARAGSPRRETRSGGFRVQVLSVSSRADADAEAARLSRLGLPVRVEPGTGPRGAVYRVRVGPYETREEAEEASRRLSSQGRRDTWIVRPGQ
ncbi:MAG TPA: SPOR domain-containing protein [Thermoanaerobaculia bacterium]|jgi:cell division septation protein DedD|nr:SPOR domain-containing protein [Thermoanaerobaculia bacterium]